MASKPNPSWSEPQKRVYKEILEGIDLVVPYYGPEIPLLDNHTPEQLCDMLGVVKAGFKAFEKVEKILKERFKARMSGKVLRGTRFEATLSDSTRTALDQSKVKLFLQQADDEGIDLEVLLDGVVNKTIRVPNNVFIPEEDGVSNTERFMSSSPVETLNVKAI